MRAYCSAVFIFIYLLNASSAADDVTPVSTNTSAGPVLTPSPHVESPPPVATPVFLEEPETEYYIARERTLVLKCKAIHTERIIFKCNNVWLAPSLHKTVVGEMVTEEAAGNVKFVETSIELTRASVEEASYGADKDTTCECHAWLTAPQSHQALTIKSRPGRVKLAYMRRKFEREPLSTSAMVTSSLLLHCLPPIADPLPQVFWLKDGVELDVEADTNLIISNEGNLIFTEVRLSDRGNYSCGANNLAARRFSEPAAVSVYVYGGWTQWGAWSQCTECPNSYQRRYRTCIQSAPVNEGTPCTGEALQGRSCRGLCPGDDYLTNSEGRTEAISGNLARRKRRSYE